MAATTTRTLDLLSLLQSHRHWPARELTDRLGVSDRTLRRDIERLRELGYGIESTRGTAGGYRLEAGTGLPPLLLTDDEGVAIAVGLRSQAAAGLRGAEHTTLSALAKIEQVLPAALRRRIEALQSHTSSQPPAGAPPGSGPTVDTGLLGLLALCCRDSERVRMRYTDASGAASARSIEPHRLVLLGRRWYLLAWDRDRDDWRTFRVDRVDDVFQTRVRFEPRPLAEGEAEQRVQAAVRWRDARVRARVHIDVAPERFHAALGWWARDAVPDDSGGTVWPLEAETVEHLAFALSWVPAELTYRVEASDEVLAALRAHAARFARALSPVE
ncbi:helix-turn-helix transcriptional regulator [Agromyces aerolatus]|uniref:helix-turn-helix transcriptional regulator n=1 Tax=Agromyces sp. LY-1074 TaxID=3074080 RepID=UPI00285B58ED|nr:MULTISPECIES: transcriptional regulator [unclassified Agromyces]MDR5701549.1 transcriptional regulator [Agromyces sp. LY-1074]MDR5707844.1 transcriptional regulator [Agromyces sp. LY-1358]